MNVHCFQLPVSLCPSKCNLYVLDIVCKKGTSSRKISVGEVDSFEFRTQAGATYAPNTRCHVTYIVRIETFNCLYLEYFKF